MADDDEGVLKSIESWEDMPKRLLEAIMEGLAKEPSKWAILGLGFYLGYKGMDVLAYFTKNFAAIANGMTGGGATAFFDAQMDLNKLMIIPGEPIKEFLIFIGAAHRVDQPKPTSVDNMANDPDATALEQWKLSLETKLIAGAMGALIAATLTTPGFFSGVGEIVKGIGEIVPG